MAKRRFFRKRRVARASPVRTRVRYVRAKRFARRANSVSSLGQYVKPVITGALSGTIDSMVVNPVIRALIPNNAGIPISLIKAGVGIAANKFIPIGLVKTYANEYAKGQLFIAGQNITSNALAPSAGSVGF